MSENNLPNDGMENEEITETQEVIDTNEEPAEETAEETVEETVFEDEEPTAEPAEESIPEEEPIDVDALKAKLGAAETSAKKFKTSAVAAWIIAAVLVCTDAYYFMTNIYNKYNHMGYYDVDGYTVGDVVSSMGMDFETFKEMYGLPGDMRKDTKLLIIGAVAVALVGCGTAGYIVTSENNMVKDTVGPFIEVTVKYR